MYMEFCVWLLAALKAVRDLLPSTVYRPILRSCTCKISDLKILQFKSHDIFIYPRYQEEITRLKAEKLELLRQNVSSQREVKRLRERETQLQTDLGTASREIQRLRLGIREANKAAAAATTTAN